jgi:hypothetical protein
MFDRFFKPRMKAGMETSYKAGIFFSSGRLALLKLLFETLQHEKGVGVHLPMRGMTAPNPFTTSSP